MLGGRTRFVLVKNALVLETNALKMLVQTSAPPQLHITTDFQTELSKLLITGTHLQAPQVVYAMTFAAGQKAFKLSKFIEKTNNLLLTLLAACTAHAQ